MSTAYTSKALATYTQSLYYYVLILARRSMSEHRTFPLVPSRFQWGKFKDLLHFYTLLGIIPVGAVLFYTNVFIGPATLSEIPEGYVPKHWEYYNVNIKIDKVIDRELTLFILAPGN